MLRTCNVLRIASLPVLRNDGSPGRRTTRTARDGGGRERGLRNPGEARCVAPTGIVR
ncbi:MAG: hypothetical protein LBM98_10705 [Oscillospiraceae bacterium]|nr:hypothetical protein [Oscillospiraceae bacterium]